MAVGGGDRRVVRAGRRWHAVAAPADGGPWAPLAAAGARRDRGRVAGSCFGGGDGRRRCGGGGGGGGGGVGRGAPHRPPRPPPGGGGGGYTARGGGAPA